MELPYLNSLKIIVFLIYFVIAYMYGALAVMWWRNRVKEGKKRRDKELLAKWSLLGSCLRPRHDPLERWPAHWRN